MKRFKILAVAAALVFVYIPSRLFVLNFVKQAGTDTELYARYAYMHRLASERRVSFHELYRDRGLADIARGGPAMFDSLAMTVVAYPPFAVTVMTVPAWFICSDLPSFTTRYKKNFRLLCAAAEFAGVLAACLLVLTLYGNEKAVAFVFRMSILILTGLSMPRILYDRLDVVLGAFLVLSLALLVRRRVFFSFLVFAFAVNFKLVPIFLLPVWALGSFRTSDFDTMPIRKRIFSIGRMALTRGSLLCMLIAGVTLAYAVAEGRGVIDFLKFHFDRGVHIESIWGSLSLLTARLAGTPFHMDLAYGAYNVSTPAATVLGSLSLIIVAVLLTAATIILIVRRSLMKEGALPTPDGAVSIESALLFLCIVFSFSRIFSPQYLFALVPLVSLLPYNRGGAFAISCLFIGVCLLSALIYPVFYSKAILHGPSWFGLFLLTSRMVLLAGMTGLLWIRQFSRREAGGTDKGLL